MWPGSWFRPSLARKTSLLFGTAVLLTISVTLAFPWIHMQALNEQAMLLQAKRVATAAVQTVDLSAPDWEAAQGVIDVRWPRLAQEMGLPLQPPELVCVDYPPTKREKEGVQEPDGFRGEAVEHLNRRPDQRYYWRLHRDQRLFRLAMAIRAGEIEPHPRMLRGIVDVRLPIAQDAGYWNTIVTALAGASGALLAILVFYMVTERIVLRPLHSLRRVAEQVATGDIDVRASITSGDEFQKLSDAVNNMLTHLRMAEEEQRRINRSLDIRLGELAETNVALYEANKFKSEFLANVSHELRTPLVSIIGFAELLRDAMPNPDADRARLARYSENILTSGRSLLDLINDLLDLAKIEAGKMELHLAEFSLSELCQDLLDFVRPLADQRQQQLTFHPPPEPPRCRTDSGKIKQILYNLLSNAVKFTPAGGSISLSVERVGEDRARLAVRDTGPGIPPSRHAEVFEQFRQLDSSETREHQGTGLGLAITRELVLMLGGTIEVDSDEGRGAAFLVTLPIVLDNRVAKTRLRLL